MKPYATLSEASETAQKHLKNAWERAKTIFTMGKPIPTLSWGFYGYSTVAYAYYKRNDISLNKNFLYSPNFMDNLEHTINHELAHIIACTYFGSTGHDASWRRVCRQLGINGCRTSVTAPPMNCKGAILQCSCGQCFNIIRKSTIKDIHNGICKCPSCGSNLKDYKIIKDFKTGRKKKKTDR